MNKRVFHQRGTCSALIICNLIVINHIITYDCDSYDYDSYDFDFNCYDDCGDADNDNDIFMNSNDTP